MGIDGKALDFLDSTGKVFPKQGVRWESPRHWSEYYDEETRALVREKEKLLFEIFPEYDGTAVPEPAGG